MKHLKIFESFLPRVSHYKNICWYNAKVGDILPESDIYGYIEQLHRTEDDFIEGDLPERIEQFSKYKLMMVPIEKINIDEWELDEDYLEDYQNQFEETRNYPPIVLDGDTSYSFDNKFTIIDGNHRVNALDRLGVKLVKAWVGIKST